MAVADWGGVMLECGPNEVVVCLLPMLTDNALTALNDAPSRNYDIAALLVFNHCEHGFLWTSQVQRHLDIPPSKTYATSPDSPVDRYPGAANQSRAQPFAPELRSGSLLLRWDRIRRVLTATWSGARVKAAVGPELSLDGLPTGTNALIGSVGTSKATLDRADLQRAILVTGCPGDTSLATATQLGLAGVDVTCVPPASGSCAT
jgi:hypothetical protein